MTTTLTIEHIATLAEVSRSTVSRVLNNHPSVRPTVRERVLQVIREQNYAPQAAARNLASSRTDTIGLLIPRTAAKSLADPFIAGMIQSLFEASAQHGYFGLLALLTTDMEPGFYERAGHQRDLPGVMQSRQLEFNLLHVRESFHTTSRLDFSHSGDI